MQFNKPGASRSPARSPLTFVPAPTSFLRDGSRVYNYSVSFLDAASQRRTDYNYDAVLRPNTLRLDALSFAPNAAAALTSAPTITCSSSTVTVNGIPADADAAAWAHGAGLRPGWLLYAPGADSVGCTDAGVESADEDAKAASASARKQTRTRTRTRRRKAKAGAASASTSESASAFDSGVTFVIDTPISHQPPQLDSSVIV